MRRASSTVLTALVLAAAGCGAAEPAAPTTPRQTPAVQAPPSRPVATVDAGTVIAKLKAAGIAVTGTAVQDENTDPNNLLGRPNGYLTRASGDLAGGNPQADRYGIDRGLVVETFPDAESTKTRSQYIQALLKGSPLLGSEWHYTTGDGRALVRVTGKVKPSAAKKIEAAVKTM